MTSHKSLDSDSESPLRAEVGKQYDEDRDAFNAAAQAAWQAAQ